jgi:arginyl-tRNA synthetase|tara:strand:- start:5419 stop:7152 length:1734 start_codon:yes stop_codon:yes gene_type:complete
LIDIINKEIKKFLSSIEKDKKEIDLAINKSSTSILDDLGKGHLTTNVCMVAASIFKLNPKDLANNLKNQLDNLNIFESVDIAGPGFINISVSREDFVAIIKFISDKKNSFGASDIGNNKKIQIEFVSANPTGPLHVGHGRGAAYGDAIGRILESTGSIVEKEYYVNDAGRQIDILTASIILKLIKNDIGEYFPKNAYKGKYIEEITKKLDKKININMFKQLNENFSDDPEEEIDQVIKSLQELNNDSWNLIKSFSLKDIVKSIEDDLKLFNVNFDKWFYESSLGVLENASSDIASAINKLEKNGHAYEKDNAMWLNTDISDDDKHRVLIRDNGKATYFASDVAYHKNKVDRGFDQLINIWGADHHGYIKRIQASLECLGTSKNILVVKLVQFANIFKDGKKVKMSTRSGEFYTLKNLIDEIGSDAARFYYLSKQADQHLDFDLNLAKSDSKENIFYYIQYAHARIISLEEKADQSSTKFKKAISSIENGDYLKCDKLIHEITKYPHIINKAALTLQPHIIIYYLRDLSQLFHSFYNDNHVLSETKENIDSILLCLSAVRQVISNGLNVLGITPMQKM